MKPMTMTTTTSVLLLATLSTVAQAEPAGEPPEPLDPDMAFELSAIGAWARSWCWPTVAAEPRATTGSTW